MMKGMKDLSQEWQNEKLEILGLKDKGLEKVFLIVYTSTMITKDLILCVSVI